jgi:hypothetical protein
VAVLRLLGYLLDEEVSLLLGGIIKGIGGDTPYMFFFVSGNLCYYKLTNC